MMRFAAVMVVVGCLGGATGAQAAETPPPTVSVVGVAQVAISQTASQAEANAVYRQGLTAAIADGHEKAEFLATQTGAKVGAIQTIVERGGSIDCVQPAEEGPLTAAARYNGAEPDFGSAQSYALRFGASVPAAPPVAPPRRSHGRRKKHEVSAKKAAGVPVSCTLSTQVSLSYLLS